MTIQNRACIRFPDDEGTETLDGFSITDDNGNPAFASPMTRGLKRKAESRREVVPPRPAFASPMRRGLKLRVRAPVDADAHPCIRFPDDEGTETGLGLQAPAR